MQQIGRYEILHEIGRGAMGVVFKGRDPLIGRAVAVKTITAGVAENADLRERFYREAKAAGGLQHANIVTIYEMAESGGDPFIVMEYLEGESLEKVIARKAPLSLQTKISYIVQACRAFKYAHGRGVVHRDIKPANIMVTREGFVKVVDFGIACITETSKTQTGMLLGTLAYMSPEQLHGQHADTRCDIWALGVVLYELITYERPFAGENHAALLLSILQDQPRPIRDVTPQCPIEVERIVARTLRKDDKDRYPTMDALLIDLEAIHSSLERDRRAGNNQSLPTIGNEAPRAEQAHRSERNTPVAPTLFQQRQTIASPASSAAGVAIAEKPLAHPRAKPSPITSANLSMARPNTPQRSASAALYATLAVFLFITLGALGYRKISAGTSTPGIKPNATLPASPPTSTTPLVPMLPAEPTSVPAPNAAEPLPSVEDQQRHLIDLAHEDADTHDYKTAQARLDAAAKLNGPLNGLISDLHRQYGEQAHGVELERAARREQALWDQAMSDMESGRLDDAEKSFRDILTLSEGGHRGADAERYVDRVIPQRRQQDQLWAAVQAESNSAEAGHLLKEVKALDELMAVGGTREQQARQMRDALIIQMIRGNARRNGRRTAAPVVSEGEQAQMVQLENQFINLVQRGDALAMEQLQQLRPKFKAVADVGGPLAMNPRDYLNNLIPKAQKQIAENLAAAESETEPNSVYDAAVKDYGRAVATRDLGKLRSRVLPKFQQIAQSGGIRAKEAEQYVNVLIPAALKGSGG